MALFPECMPQYAQKVLDTADIVRDAICRQLSLRRVRISCVAASQFGLNNAHPMVKTPKIIAKGAKMRPPNQFV